MTARKSRADYPDGVLGIYDNGGLREYRGEWRGSADRYTVVYDGETDGRGQTFYPYLAMSTRPFHPQGITEQHWAPAGSKDGAVWLASYGWDAVGEDDGEPGLFCDNYDGSGCGAPIDLPDGWEVEWT